MITTRSKEIKDIQEKTSRLFYLTAEADKELFFNARNDAHEILSCVLNTPTADFSTTETFENAILQYGLLINNGEAKTFNSHLKVDGQAMFKHYFTDQLIEIQYKNFSEEQLQELVTLYNKHYPSLKMALFRDGSMNFLHFNLVYFYREVVIDMFLNESFQDLLKKAKKSSYPWNADVCAETNIIALFTIPRPKQGLFCPPLSPEEIEAKKILEAVKKGSDLKVFSHLLELQSKPLTKTTQDKVQFALENLEYVRPVYQRREELRGKTP